MTPGSLATSGLLLACLAASSCAAPAPATRVIPLRSYVLGTLGDREIDLRDVCGDQPAQTLEVAPSASSLALGVLTLGLYTPRQVRITCAPLR
jgi:hypothetical protein